MQQSHVIEVGGAFIGAAVRHADRFRFIAVDTRAEELDLSEWNSLQDVERVVRFLVVHGRLPQRPSLISVGEAA